MGKRANGEGSIRKRPDGRWEARISLPNGKRKAFYGKTRTEAYRKLTEALKARQDALPIPLERQTVEKYLKEWLQSVKPSLRPRTWDRYEQYVRLHAVPHLGHLPLARLFPQHLQALYRDCLETGLSAMTVVHLHTVIHTALEKAARWGLVARNVADLVSPPRPQRKEMQTLSPEQARTFLEAAKGDRLEALYVLALTTGMRQGELLALHWQDVDLEGQTLQVRFTLQRRRSEFVFAEPKTPRSKRQVILTNAAATALRRHRARQVEERLRQGPAWEDTGLVFANQIGQPLYGVDMTRARLYPLLRRAGLPGIRFHDLRHTAATLLLGQGMHAKVVADMLGHSAIAITLDLYSHTSPAMHRQAAQAMDAVLQG